MSKVTIIIPNYNGIKFMKDCIESLRIQTYKNFEILVVDNGSKDESVDYLRDLESYESNLNIKAIYLDENLGFAGGVNVGLAACDSKYVILLNNDTEVFPDYVEMLVDAIEKSDRIFAVNPLMINAHDKELVDDAGDGYSLLGWGYQIGVGEKVADFTKRRAVFSACAGASIYRKSILDEIGYFDEMHFAYLEDMDLSFRARLRGYIIGFEPRAKVYHLGSATSGSKYNSFKVRLAARNNIYLIYKNMTNLQIAFNFFPLLLGTLIKTAFFFKKGFLTDYISGLKEGFKNLGECERVDFSEIKKTDILALEGEIIAGTFEYVYRFIKRHSS
nr:glycosyltransferase family 2 protein [uncultured Lachnoanaerobaculum sp.]